MLGIPTKIPWNHFCAWWRIFNVFFSTFAVAFRTTHGQSNTRKCDTGGFVHVASLCGIVGSPSSFIRSLIGRTGKIWSIVYINAKLTYASGTLACTITLRTVAHALMVHARVLEVYVHFEFMYTTFHIFPVLSIKDLIKEDVDPTTPHKLATSTKPLVLHLRVLFCSCFV